MASSSSLARGREGERGRGGEGGRGDVVSVDWIFGEGGGSACLLCFSSSLFLLAETRSWMAGNDERDAEVIEGRREGATAVAGDAAGEEGEPKGKAESVLVFPG